MQIDHLNNYFTYVDLVPWPGLIVLWTNRSLVIFQVSSGLIGRVTHVDQSFNREMELIPRVSPEFELTLDNKSVLHAIETMNFFQMKGTAALISKFSNLLWKWRSELAHYEYQSE